MKALVVAGRSFRGARLAAVNAFREETVASASAAHLMLVDLLSGLALAAVDAR